MIKIKINSFLSPEYHEKLEDFLKEKLVEFGLRNFKIESDYTGNELIQVEPVFPNEV